MKPHRTVPAAVVIVGVIVLAGYFIQAAELEGEIAGLVGIIAVILAGLLAGALFGEAVYDAIKGLTLMGVLLVGFLILALMLVAKDTKQEIEESSGLEAVGGTIVFILLIILILAMIVALICLVILGLVAALGGWVGIKIHSRFFQEPMSPGRGSRPPPRPKWE